MQELNHLIKPNENGLYHVKFTKIVKDGKRTRDTYVYQAFTSKEFKNLQKVADEFGLGGATQFDEMEVIHDPTVSKPAAEVEKPKKVIGRPAVKAAQKED